MSVSQESRQPRYGSDRFWPGIRVCLRPGTSLVGTGIQNAINGHFRLARIAQISRQSDTGGRSCRRGSETRIGVAATFVRRACPAVVSGRSYRRRSLFISGIVSGVITIVILGSKQPGGRVGKMAFGFPSSSDADAAWSDAITPFLSSLAVVARLRDATPLVGGNYRSRHWLLTCCKTCFLHPSLDNAVFDKVSKNNLLLR